MKRIFVSRSAHTVLLLALLTGMYFIHSRDYEWTHSLRDIAFDTYNTLHPRQQTDKVAVVDIDNASLSKDGLGQWPWPRTVMAKMVDRLKAMGAKAIAFDMVFAEQDRTSPALLAKEYPVLAGQIGGLKDHDQAFADSLRAAGNVVTGFVCSTGSSVTRRAPAVSKAVFIGPNADDLKNSVFFMDGVTANIPLIEDASAGNGHFCVTPEDDGLIRRVPLLTAFQGGADKAITLYPSLALEALRVAQDPRLLIKIRRARESELGPFDAPYRMKVGDYEIPFDRDGKFFVYYSKARPEKYIPAWRVLDGSADPDSVRGKIVFVGTSAEGLHDIRSTPLDLFIPGVELHLNVVEQILTGQYLLRPALLSHIETAFMLLIGLGIILLSPFVGAVAMAGVTFTLIGGIGYTSWWMFLHQGLLLDPVYPSLMLAVLFAASSALSYIRAEAERQQVRAAFSHYISPDFMKELTANPDKLKLGGETRELTVMFTDIRGFTGISEKLPPAELIQLMNGFLTPMSSLVMESRGTIDKYMGDAMMAFWNAPLDDPDHARHACQAALKMAEALRPLNENLKGRGIEIKAGIGINTGQASVGNMGSSQRFAYSALGDAVNLASRLESQTKAYGVSILVGSETAQKAGDFAFLELDLLRVKGKAEAERIFTLIGDDARAKTPQFTEAAALHAEMMKRYRLRDFDKALSLIERCAAALPELSGYYAIFSGRIEVLKTNRPGDDWDGTFVALTK